MSYDKNTGYCFCERCGHSWYAKIFTYSSFRDVTKPRACAKCKNKNWDNPRVYTIKDIVPMAKRWKTTWKPK